MKKLILFVLHFLSYNCITAQIPNDCVNSITVCGNGNFVSNASGIGNTQEVSSCGSSEHNSIWLKINIAQPGTLGFDLIPNDPNINVDYDFWVFGPATPGSPNRTCSSLGVPIRCSTSNPGLSGSTNNHTGMNLNTTATTQSYNNCCGYVRSLSVLPGQSYYIVIDRPHGYGGFELNWSWTPTVAGTSPFYPPPVANQIPDYKTCSTSNTGIFDLNSLRSQINSDLVSNTVSFHSTFANAIDNISPLPNFTTNSTNDQTIYVRVTNILSKCYSTTTFKLVVNPIPTAAIDIVNSSVCPNDNATINFTGTPNSTIQYSINSGSSQTAILNSSGQFSLNQVITANTTFTLIDVKTLDSNGNTICTQPINTSKPVTIKQVPVITATPPTGSICSGATASILLSSSPVGATFAWTATQTDISGASAGSGSTISQVLTSTSNALGTANYTITPTLDSCVGIPISTLITVNPLPVATATPADTTICSGNSVSIPLTSSLTGASFTWIASQNNVSGATAGNGTLINQSLTLTGSPGSVVYSITPSLNGCDGPIITSAINVIASLTASASPSAVTICSSDTTNIGLTSNAIGTTYVWTSVATNVTGASSGSGTRIADVLTATVNTPGTVVYTIIPSGSGCTGAPITATVTVNPLPTATISGTTTICNGSSTTISFSGTPNAIVTYTVNGGLNQTTVLNNSGGGSVSTGNLTSTATYQLVSVVAAGLPACTQVQSGSVVVTVIPVPLVNSVVSSPTICSGQPTGISLSSNVTSATFNWTITQSGVIGASAGNGNTISQNLTTTGTTTGFVTYNITANEGACQGPVTSILITVNPIPVVTPSTVLQSVCSGSISSIQLTSNVTGTVFNWNVIQNNVTGASNGTGSSIAQILTATSNNVGEAVYSVTPANVGCPGTPILVTIRVNPIPVATANVAVTTICSSSTTDITLTSSIAGTTFSWSVIQTGIFGAIPGSGAAIAQMLTTVNSAQGTVFYTITPTFNGCSGVPITVPITVNPTPEVFGSASATICSGGTPNISLFPSIAATTFAWTVNATNVTGAQAGSGMVINDILTASPNFGTAIYSVTPTASGCSGSPLMVTITVNPIPVTQINGGVICVDQATNVSFKNYILDTYLSNTTYYFAWYDNNGVIINGATNSSYEATQAGNYSVIVTNIATGCQSLLTQAVVSASFPGTALSLTETLAFSDNATISVAVSPTNTIYQYTLDYGLTQSSNVFTNVAPGHHIVTVTDENGCTNLTKLVTIIGYPTYFTPNGDSFNDTWNIVGLGATATVFIYDRYGKLIKQISPTSQGWDGTLNGQPMMSTDYWFTVDYSEPQTGESKTFRSHFSLKR